MAPGSPTPPIDREASVASTPRRRRGLALLLLLAAGLRMGWVGLTLLDPFDGVYFDMAWYDQSARQIAAGRGLVNADGTPTAQWPPLYPVFLAGVYALTGGSLLAGKLANGLLGALTVFFTYRIGCRLVGWRAGWLAGLLFAASPDAIFHGNFVMSEVAFGTIFTGSVLAAVVLLQRRPPAGPTAWLALGVLLGLASLTRGIAIAWLAVPALAAWRAAGSPRPVAPRVLAAALGLALVVAPWTVRNTVRMGYPVLIASSIGMVLANAHSPWETGVSTIQGVVARQRVRRQFEHLPAHEQEIAVMRTFTRSALAYMWSHPGHELRTIPVRVQQLFLHGHVGLETGRRQAEGGGPAPVFSPGLHRVLAGVADALFYALLALGLLGLRRLWRAPDVAASLVPLSVAYFCFWHFFLFPAGPRYHFPLLPLFAVSAAPLLLDGVERLRARGAA